MILKLELNDQESEILNQLILSLNQPELTAEEAAAALLSNLLKQIWAEYNSTTKHIFN